MTHNKELHLATNERASWQRSSSDIFRMIVKQISCFFSSFWNSSLFCSFLQVTLCKVILLQNQLHERTAAPINRLIAVTFRSQWTALVFVLFLMNVDLLCWKCHIRFSPAARPGHLCVGTDGSSWTVQSPGGGKHTQWVSRAAWLSTVPSQNSISQLFIVMLCCFLDYFEDLDRHLCLPCCMFDSLDFMLLRSLYFF